MIDVWEVTHCLFWSVTAGRLFTSWASWEAQAYWSGEPIPAPADLPDRGAKPGSPVLQAGSLPTEPSGKPPWLVKATLNLKGMVCSIVWYLKYLDYGSYKGIWNDRAPRDTGNYSPLKFVIRKVNWFWSSSRVAFYSVYGILKILLKIKYFPFMFFINCVKVYLSRIVNACMYNYTNFNFPLLSVLTIWTVPPYVDISFMCIVP